MWAKLLPVVVVMGWWFPTYSQPAQPASAAQILHNMKKLGVLGSVLYIAAHPDDENTRLIAWLSNEKMLRTGYLSLTRGDGGQNLIGDEQGVELGLIRTQELLAARRIDGGIQFFTRAYDFGYSKSSEETFAKWNHEQVLADAVYIVRSFQPDIVITRFPEDGRAGHGHHSASGIIGREVFDAAADPTRFPEQIKQGLKPWQVKRVLWNTFNFGGNSNTIDSTQFSVDVGGYLPLLGKSLGELAGESRSQHKSQGFGVSRQRGNAREYFTTLKGEPPKKDLLDGVEFGWKRLDASGKIERMIGELISRFSPEDPAASLPGLKDVATAIYRLPASYWRDQKLAQVRDLMLQCAGIYMEATVRNAGILVGDTVPIAISMINRSKAEVTIRSLEAGDYATVENINLPYNTNVNRVIVARIAGGVMETQPYWLRESQENGLFKLSADGLLNRPENEPLSVRMTIDIGGLEFSVRQPIQHRYVDPVKAEQYQPAYLTHPFLLFNNPGILLFKKNTTDSGRLFINISAAQPDTVSNGSIRIASPGKFVQVSKLKPVSWTGGDVYTHSMAIGNYLKGTNTETDELEIEFVPGGKYGDAPFANARRSITYDHIPTQTWHYRDRVKVLHIDLKTNDQKIGYLPGAGDRVMQALQQMGYQVTELKKEDLTLANLKKFDAVVTGVRAYNVHEYLASAYKDLMDYVQSGGNLIVQYNTSNFISQLRGKIAPYDFSLGRNRITDEQSPVLLRLPDHPVFKYPNRISEKDFEGWVQERSIYHTSNLNSAEWQFPLAFKDPGENWDSTLLAIAPFGKGNFVYTGIVFFRQLPSGVPGAYRLLANLIELPKRL